MQEKVLTADAGWFCLVALGAVLLLAACSSTPITTTSAPAATSIPTVGGGTGGEITVTITTDNSGHFVFRPATLHIAAGTLVIWRNMTAVPHTVTSTDGKTFNSGISHPIRADGGIFSFRFDQAGNFTYHCQFHPYMVGTITVQYVL